MTNCVNYGTVQFDSDSKSEEQIDYHAVTGGGLSGNAAATAWKNCYEASVSDLPLFGKEGNGTIMEVHRIDRAQRAGEASAAFISENAASYAHTSSLAEALNAYVSAQNGAKRGLSVLAAGRRYVSYIKSHDRSDVKRIFDR